MHGLRARSMLYINVHANGRHIEVFNTCDIHVYVVLIHVGLHVLRMCSSCTCKTCTILAVLQPFVYIYTSTYYAQTEAVECELLH